MKLCMMMMKEIPMKVFIPEGLYTFIIYMVTFLYTMCCCRYILYIIFDLANIAAFQFHVQHNYLF